MLNAQPPSSATKVVISHDRLRRRSRADSDRLGTAHLVMSAVNLGEVVYRTIREHGLERAQEAVARIGEYSIEIVDVDRELAIAAAYLKGSYRMSYADCIAAALGQRLDAPIVTGDPDFKQLEGQVAIDWLPGADGD